MRTPLGCRARCRASSSVPAGRRSSPRSSKSRARVGCASASWGAGRTSTDWSFAQCRWENYFTEAAPGREHHQASPSISFATVTRTAVVTARSAIMTGTRIHQLPTAPTRTTSATIRRADAVNTTSRMSPRSTGGGDRRSGLEGSSGWRRPGLSQVGAVRARLCGRGAAVVARAGRRSIGGRSSSSRGLTITTSQLCRSKRHLAPPAWQRSPRRRTSPSTVALLCSVSRAAKTKVTTADRERRRSSVNRSRWAPSSAR